MMQIKAIFSVLLRDWTFEMAQPSDTYRNDHSKMVVQLAAALPGALLAGGNDDGYRIVVDRDLCQGHGVCESEAPEVFVVERKATTVTVLDEAPARVAACRRSRPP